MKHLVGAGHVAERIIKESPNESYSVYDNSPDLQRTKFHGMTVEPVENLAGKLHGIVLICTTSIDEIYAQLEDLNISLPVNIPDVLGGFREQSRLLDVGGDFLVASGLPSSNLFGASGGLFRVTENSNHVVVKELIPGPCHAVVKDGDKYVVSVQAEGIVVLDKYFRRIKTVGLAGGSRPHGVAITHDAYYVVASNRDSLLRVDKSSDEICEIKFSSKKDVRQSAQHHANDVEIIDGFAYVSMFSVTGSWKNGLFDGGLLEINLSDQCKKPIPLPVKLPHSVRSIDQFLVVLNSFEGSVYSFGCLEEYRFNGFLRGLDYDSDFIYLAESRNRNSTPLKRASQPVSIDSKINIVCRKSHFSRSLSLPKQISEVHSILKV